MGGRDNSQGNGNYELGDLDLGPAAVPASPPTPRPAPAPQAAPTPQASRGGADDLDLGGFSDGGGASLELEHTSNDNWRGRIDHLIGGADEEDPLNAPEATSMPELDAVPRRPARLSGTRTQREAETIEHDPRRKARELAGFGPAPTGVVGCVPYVVKVLARRQHLGSERKKVARAQQELKGRLDEALLELGRALSTLPTERLSRVKPTLDTVLMARGAAEAADQNAAELRRRTEQEIREIEALLVQRKAALEPFLTAEAQARQRFDQAENDRKRAMALLARVDIERRAIENAEGQVDPARDQALEQTRTGRQQGVAQAQAAADEARAAHEHTRAELDERQREVDQLNHQRRKLGDQAEKEQRKLESAAAGAEGELTKRLRELGRAANEAGLDELGGDRARRVRELDKQCGAALDQKHLYELARKSFDRGAVARGVGLVVGLLGAAAAALHLL